MQMKDLSSVVKASSQCQRLIIRQCYLCNLSGDLDFTIPTDYNITHLYIQNVQGNDSKGSGKWGSNPDRFEHIAKAIGASGLAKSLTLLDVGGSGIEESKAKELIDKHCPSNNIQIEEGGGVDPSE